MQVRHAERGLGLRGGQDSGSSPPCERAWRATARVQGRGLAGCRSRAVSSWRGAVRAALLVRSTLLEDSRGIFGLLAHVLRRPTAVVGSTSASVERRGRRREAKCGVAWRLWSWLRQATHPGPGTPGRGLRRWGSNCPAWFKLSSGRGTTINRASQGNPLCPIVR